MLIILMFMEHAGRPDEAADVIVAGGPAGLMTAAPEQTFPEPEPRRKEGRKPMNIKNTDAGRDLEALRAVIAGQVFVPGQPGYDQARQAWNLAVDERPSVVVVAASAADVVEAVRHARAHGMRVAPQGTGHGAGPLEPLDGAMLLRTTRMRQVDIDPAARTARAEAGAVWQDVIVPAAEHGLAALAGSSPNVGVTAPARLRPPPATDQNRLRPRPGDHLRPTRLARPAPA
jgi:hypothetical protein